MKILLVDDDDLIKDGLKIILNLQEDMEVIGTSSNGQEALEFCQASPPDLVVMDIRMAVMDGVLGAKCIKVLNPGIKILMLTTFKDDEYIRASLENGADGYILKNQGADKIIDAIRGVYQGHLVFDKELRSQLKSPGVRDPKKSFEDYDLSDREGHILSLIGQGLSNKEIAETMFLSQGTVRNYITNLLDKLDLRDRTQLAIFFIRNIDV